MSRRWLAGLVLTGALVVLCEGVEPLAAAPQPAGRPAATAAIVIGDISSEPTKKIRRFQPFADYLAANLSAFGIGEGRVVIAIDIQSMVRMLSSGEVHLYFDSPYPAMIVGDRSGARPVLRRWKGGVAESHSVIFTRSDSGVRTIADLRGKIIGLEHSRSTSGYFLPFAHLRRIGTNLVEKPWADVAVGRSEVGFVFTSSEENTFLWVLTGKVAAGATDSVTFEKIPPEIRASLTILAVTPAVPRHIVMARQGMAPALLEAIKTLLLRMHEVPEGRAVLKTFDETARFDEFASGPTMARMREMFRIVQGR